MLRHIQLGRRSVQRLLEGCCVRLCVQQQCWYAKKTKEQHQIEDRQLQMFVEVSMLHAWCRLAGSSAADRVKAHLHVSKGTLCVQCLTPKEVKPWNLAPDEEKEWNERAKHYSRLKMAEHRAWQKVSKPRWYTLHRGNLSSLVEAETTSGGLSLQRSRLW